MSLVRTSGGGENIYRETSDSCCVAHTARGYENMTSRNMEPRAWMRRKCGRDSGAWAPKIGHGIYGGGRGTGVEDLGSGGEGWSCLRCSA